MPAFKDLSGKRFHRLTVIERVPIAPKNGKKRTFWRVICDCGKEKVTDGALLAGGHSKSCGCLQRETVAAASIARKRPHKDLRDIWYQIRERCCNPSNKAFSFYGASGICLCPEWKSSVWSFVNYVLDHIGPRPSSGHTIDRINGKMGYLPGNIRWATRKEQSRNRKSNLVVEIDGIKGCLKEVCEKLNLSYTQMLYKIGKLKQDPQTAAATVRGIGM